MKITRNILLFFVAILLTNCERKKEGSPSGLPAF
jgi:hypothetical protein